MAAYKEVKTIIQKSNKPATLEEVEKQIREKPLPSKWEDSKDAHAQFLATQQSVLSKFGIGSEETSKPKGTQAGHHVTTGKNNTKPVKK